MAHDQTTQHPTRRVPRGGGSQPTGAGAHGSEARVGYSYRPSLDGVRAIAVIAVVAYHLDSDVLPGGFLGVDVFFVLSGYLIAGLLLAEHDRNGRVGLGAFWMRRARRLLPALAGVMVAIAAYAKWWAPTNTLDRLRVDALATLGYVANWRFAFSAQSYFDSQTVLSPLRHAWSLAVEEQFYVLFPLLAMACFASRRPARTLGIVSAIGAVVSGVLMAVSVNEADPSFVYYGTHTRAQGLLIGVTLACWSRGTDRSGVRWRDRGLQMMGAGGIAAIVVACFAISDDDDFMYRGGYFVAALSVAALVAASVRPGKLSTALSIAPLRWIGQRSYGLYLWHWPAIVALEPARTGLEGWQLAGVRLAATVVAAALSYQFLETPIRHGALRRHRFTSVSFAGAGAIVVAVAVATGGGAAPDISLVGAPRDVKPRVLVSGTSLGRTTATNTPGGSETTSETTDEHGTTAPRNPPTTTPPPAFTPGTIAVVGDSVASSALPGIQSEAQVRGIGLVSFVVPGCGIATGSLADDDGNLVPWSPDCAHVVQNMLGDLIDDYDPDVVIWWSGWENADRVVGGDVLGVDSLEWQNDLDDALEARWQQLAARGARIILVDSTPRAASPIAEADHDPKGRNVALRSRLRALAARHSGNTALVEVSRVLCPSGIPCPREIGGVTPRPDDGGHFTDRTAPWIAARLWPLAETAWEDRGP